MMVPVVGQDQAQAIRELGCDQAPGMFFGPPGPVEGLAAAFRERGWGR